MTSQRPDLDGAAVGIWGFGKEGQSLARTAAAAGAARIDAVDDAGRGTLDAPGDIANLNLWRGTEHLARLADCDVVFLSPGIPWHQPFFAQLRDAGIMLSSAPTGTCAGTLPRPSASPGPRARARQRRS